MKENGRQGGMPPEALAALLGNLPQVDGAPPTTPSVTHRQSRVDGSKMRTAAPEAAITKDKAPGFSRAGEGGQPSPGAVVSRFFARESGGQRAVSVEAPAAQDGPASPANSAENGDHPPVFTATSEVDLGKRQR